MGFLSKLFGASKPPVNQQLSNNDITIQSTVTSTSYYVEIRQKTKGLLPAIPLDILDGYISPSGGFVNYARFQVVGVNPSTNRKNKRVYETRFEEDARKCAKNEGLVEPFEITVLPSVPPSERQLEYANVLEACIPDGACSLDVSAIISRITDNDETPVSNNVACQAQKYGLKFSRYHGRAAILKIAETSLSVIEYSNFVLSLTQKPRQVYKNSNQ